jgi:broad specificity phosphatase PhoE
MHSRLKATLREIDEAHQKSHILLVSHGSPVEAMIQIMQDKNTGFGPFNDLPKNAALIHLNPLNLIA